MHGTLGKEASIVQQIASQMNRVERLIVSLHYADGLSLNEIAAVLERHESEVSRILGAVVMRVREVMHSGATAAAH